MPARTLGPGARAAAKSGTGAISWPRPNCPADLGISPSAWEEAREAMGEQQAAITIAAILPAGRPDQQCRRLSAQPDRPGEGREILDWPMVMALVRAKLDAQKSGDDRGLAGVDRGAADAGATSDLRCRRRCSKP
jgi:hypothetical protein